MNKSIYHRNGRKSKFVIFLFLVLKKWLTEEDNGGNEDIRGGIMRKRIRYKKHLNLKKKIHKTFTRHVQGGKRRHAS